MKRNCGVYIEDILESIEKIEKYLGGTNSIDLKGFRYILRPPPIETL